MSSATMPTKPAAIHSIVSMTRSIQARFMENPAAGKKGGAGGASFIVPRAGRRRRPPVGVAGTASLLRQRVVFLQRGLQLLESGITIHTGLLDAVAPGLHQRLGRLLPLGGLLGGELVDLVTGLGLDLVDAGVLELTPVLANLSRHFGRAV